MKQKISILVSVLVASTAVAQNADLGLKLGEKSRLHVGADLGTGFDTNPNYMPMSSGQFAGDATLALRPELKLVIPDDMLDVEGGVRLNYQEFFGLMDKRTAQLRQIDGDANLSLEINRKGMLGFAVNDRVTRSLDAGVAALGARLARIRNDAGLGVELRPGGGLLTFNLSYNFGIEIYDKTGTPGLLDTLGLYVSNTVLTNPEYFDNMDHQLKLRTEWRFLPKTGLFLDISGGSRTYLNSSSPNVAAFPVGIEVGAMGQISGKLAGVAKLGYANPITVENGAVTSATFIGAVGQLELRYAITETNVVTAGIRREMRPIYMYKFFTDNRVYVESHHQLMQKLQVKANLAYALLSYDASTSSQSFTTYGGGNRLDNIVEGHLSARYFVMDWLAVGVSDVLQLSFTNASGPAGNYSYWKNLTLLSVTANY